MTKKESAKRSAKRSEGTTSVDELLGPAAESSDSANDKANGAKTGVPRTGAPKTDGVTSATKVGSPGTSNGNAAETASKKAKTKAGDVASSPSKSTSAAAKAAAKKGSSTRRGPRGGRTQKAKGNPAVGETVNGMGHDPVVRPDPVAAPVDLTTQLPVITETSDPKLARRRIADLAGWRRAALLTAIVAVLTLVTVATALVLERGREPIYAARAEVFYDLDADRSFGFLREDRRLTTQLVLIEGRTVLEPVGERYDMTWEELADKTSAQMLESSEIIQIEVQDADSARAASLAGDIADEYLTLTIDEAALEERDATLAKQEAVVAELLAKEARLETVTRDLDGIEVDEETGVLPVEGQRLLDEHGRLFDSILALEAEVSSFEVIMVDAQRASRLGEAFVLDDQVSPDLMRAGIGGTLLGGLLGLGTALLLTRRREPKPT